MFWDKTSGLYDLFENVYLSQYNPDENDFLGWYTEPEFEQIKEWIEQW